MAELEFSRLPDLPQTPYLRELATRLWRHPDIVALWLGGSLAAGKGDAYSDVDLRLAVPEEALESWQAPDLDGVFGQACLAHAALDFGKSLLHHVLLENGDIYDLYVQTPATPLTNEARLVLASRDDAFRAKLTTEPEPHALHTDLEPEELRRVLEHYWLNAHKHRKALHRDLDLLAQEGLTRFRPVLVRLAYALETGRDCGDVGKLTIHGFSPVNRALISTGVLETLGLPTRDREEIVEALDALNGEVGRVGRALSERYGFAYPEGLEAVVLRHWAVFKEA